MTADTMEQRLFRLAKRQWVSPLDALQKVGCMSLAQRVSQWRASGIAVNDKWVQNGRKRFKCYRVV